MGDSFNVRSTFPAPLIYIMPSELSHPTDLSNLGLRHHLHVHESILPLFGTGSTPPASSETGRTKVLLQLCSETLSHTLASEDTLCIFRHMTNWTKKT
jgi:hypothetical protein